jgi:plasmid replication initiation protein
MTDNAILPEDKRSPLLPDRHPTPDFFVCDIFDAAPKGDMAGMEHPVFSLSSKPDHRIRRYEHNGCYLEIKPSADGLATIHDRDVLIYSISQLISALNEGRTVSRTVRFQAYDLLVATNRMTNGQAYGALRATLERLRGTTISTNITTGGTETFDVFGLIDQARVVRETRDGRMKEVEITLSEWVFRAIQHHEVLTLHRDYFRLRKPLERRIYELARKHCGQKDHWSISLNLLKKKCGSLSSDKEFRRLVSNIIEADYKYGHMPDYARTD